MISDWPILNRDVHVFRVVHVFTHPELPICKRF